MVRWREFWVLHLSKIGQALIEKKVIIPILFLPDIILTRYHFCKLLLKRFGYSGLAVRNGLIAGYLRSVNKKSLPSNQ